MRITLKNVRKRYGSRTILDGIDLTIESGQTVALIGPSGGGKSTLLRCLNALSDFDDGEVEVAGHRLHPKTVPGETHAVRRLLGMIFQDFQLFPHLTALQNVAEAPIYVLQMEAAEAKRRAARLLGEVGLADFAGSYPQQLSGGQKQRVAIARALAMEPKGLLCDEITSALDPVLKHEVLQVLENLRRTGMTLVMVTHEIGFARRAADRVIVLSDGKIIEDGPPEQVIDRPQDPRTQKFLSKILA